MEKENPRLTCYLGSLKKAWVSYCKTLDKKPGIVLREIVQEQLEKSLTKTCSKLTPLKQTKESPDDAIKQRFEVLLTPSEKAALETCSQQDQCSQRRWVINAIRAGLTKQAQFSMKEINILGESNYQLLVVGRNINQIAKAINQGGEIPSDVLDVIKDLRQIINAHTRTVSQALRASLERWDIE